MQHDEQPKPHSGHAPNELLRPKCLGAALGLCRFVLMSLGWTVSPARGQPMGPNHNTLPRAAEGTASGDRRAQEALANCSPERSAGPPADGQVAERPSAACPAARLGFLAGLLAGTLCRAG